MQKQYESAAMLNLFWGTRQFDGRQFDRTNSSANILRKIGEVGK